MVPLAGAPRPADVGVRVLGGEAEAHGAGDVDGTSAEPWEKYRAAIAGFRCTMAFGSVGVNSMEKGPVHPGIPGSPYTEALRRMSARPQDRLEEKQ